MDEANRVLRRENISGSVAGRCVHDHAEAVLDSAAAVVQDDREEAQEKRKGAQEQPPKRTTPGAGATVCRNGTGALGSA